MANVVANETTSDTAPNQKIALSLDRSDFIANALQGIPVDRAVSIGFDRTKWVEEALAIRAAYQKDMAARGAGVNLINRPMSIYLGQRNGGNLPEVVEFFARVHGLSQEDAAMVPDGPPPGPSAVDPVDASRQKLGLAPRPTPPRAGPYIDATEAYRRSLGLPPRP